MTDEKTNHHQDSLENKQAERRYNLALVIVLPCLGILIISSIALASWGDLEPNTVFTAVIGLVGTWVGTILAFYYSKDNFEAASKNTYQLIDKFQSTQEKLKSTMAKSVMLLMNVFNRYDLKTDASQVKLSDIKEAFNGYNRLPILSKDGLPKYVIHESLLNKFITDFYTGVYDGEFTKDVTTRETDFPKLTLDKFLGVEAIRKKVILGVIAAKQDNSLDVIKKKMEEVKDAQCSDVFITLDGTMSSKVIGWLTNVIILENSKV